MGALSISSPAKINLRLKVLGKRADGYHELSMIMTRLALADTITLEKINAGIELVCGDATIPSDHTNLACRAAEAFFRETKIKGGVRICLEKRIPVGGGLGGGSSNAGAVLRGLFELYGKIGNGDWIKIAAKLGADVPFFLTDKPQVLGGIGEIMRPLESLPPLYLILINPGFGVSTKEIFGILGARPLRTSPPFGEGIRGAGEETLLTGDASLASYPRTFKSLRDLLPFLENDLEAVVFKNYPEVLKVKEVLLKEGAFAALMSGSGATVFGIFENKGLRDTVAERIKLASPSRWKIYSTESTL